MIVGQIWIDGVSFSLHRFEGGPHTPTSVRRHLQVYAADEQLALLGTVRVTVQPDGPLVRLRAVWLGLHGVQRRAPS